MILTLALMQLFGAKDAKIHNMLKVVSLLSKVLKFLTMEERVLILATIAPLSSTHKMKRDTKRLNSGMKAKMVTSKPRLSLN